MGKRICVIGAGRWGRNHVKVLQRLGCLAAVIDPHHAALNSINQSYPEVKTYCSIHDAPLSTFDGFVVATPAKTHFEIATALSAYKKPILVEKPLCLSSNDATELLSTAKKNHAPIMVGHVLLFHPAIKKIKEMITTDVLGKIQYIYSNRLNLGTVRVDEDILWSFAPHDIAIFNFFLNDLPQSVWAKGGAFIQPHIHDSTVTVLKYPKNITGHIFVNWLHPFKEHRLVVIGTKGMICYEDSSEEKELQFFPSGVDMVNGMPAIRKEAKKIVPYEVKDALEEELKYFLSLSGAEEELCSGESALEVLKVLEKASESLLEEVPTSAVSGERLLKAHSLPMVSEENARQLFKAIELAAVSLKEPKYTSSHAKHSNFFVHESSVVDADVEIGEGTKIWHFSHVQSNAKIGKQCSIGQNVNIGNNVSIGNFVKIQNNVSVYEGVELEDYVFCGPSMVFTNVLRPRSKYPQRGSKYYEKTVVREGASLGANCTIVAGITIGKHAFIGAGTVVTKSVPDYALMVGNPARQIAWVCECGHKLLKRKAMYQCDECERCYLLDGEKLKSQPPRTQAIHEAKGR